MVFFKKIFPESLLKFIRPYYHGALALWGSWYFGRPSDKMVIIGVTGTNGKTTTVNLIARILQEAGFKVGYTSTTTVNIDGKEHLNKLKMTMPSGWLLQKWMKQMVERGCEYAVLEVSSEGLSGNRHLGINFDGAVFTNLTPEHIESHGGFKNYKEAKGKLFQVLSAKHKVLKGGKVLKSIITNADSEHSDYYKSFKADKYISYGIKNPADFQAKKVVYSPDGIKFDLGSYTLKLNLKGQFDVYNSLASIATAVSQGITLDTCKTALEKVVVVPGRMEIIQTYPFTVVVDYAYEPEEMKQLYETVSRWPRQKIIQVLGPTGGGRDKARIPVLGKMAAKFADYVVITTDDPYDDDPQDLIHLMASGAVTAGKIIKENLFRNPDRRGAIAKAFSLAGPGDLVLITGKGADQKMALSGGKYIDWDDRVVARAELSNLTSLSS